MWLFRLGRSRSLVLPLKKLILNCGLSPGDVVMLTAAVRDLHHWYPGQFLTDVRTVCPDLWENNPHLTPLSDKDPDATKLDCRYPLINGCNGTPYHCLHGFIDFLNHRLRLSIKPTAFKGDIHLSAQEKAWYSQVHEAAGRAIPFWIVAAGGKHDVTIKWWQSDRYQQVIDHFRGKVQFVQVGQYGHHHPRLSGVIDLRGQTTLRELIRLVYHSEGVLCSITALMHLAAAVETKPGQLAHRPCVVVAGGREPAHWEAYPGHQFVHTIGALPCCAHGGCWKDRAMPLRDGDRRDRPGRRCVDVVAGIPRCMDMITPEEVIRRVELYYQGNVLRYLSPIERRAAERGVAATATNAVDDQPLTIHSAGMACEKFIQTIPAFPNECQGRGIVICGGGIRYFTCAWVCINMLRRLRCKLPIELWHLAKGEMDHGQRALLTPLHVRCVDASRRRRQFPARTLHGWELKPYALLHCSFREVLLLDADNVPVINPEFLFDTPQFRSRGAVFWPDYQRGKNPKAAAVWRSCGLREPQEAEFESGQMVVDRGRCWRALCLAMWFNENSDFYYQYLHGDKETFHLAFRKLRQPYVLVPHPIHTLDRTMCQHDFTGRRVFQHRNTDKWDICLCNRRVENFRFERRCRAYVVQLQQVWNGGVGARLRKQLRARAHAWTKPLRVDAVMISCAERNGVRQQTLDNLRQTDWGTLRLHVQMDEGTGDDHRERQTHCTLLALKQALERAVDYILFLEDDLDFNRHLRENLYRWQPLATRVVTLASLYNPGVRELACDFKNHARIVAPTSVFGSQAFLLSRATAEYVVRHWRRAGGMQDIKISRLAACLKKPLLYHAPSLVQHIGARSTWGGGFHQAADFDANWRA